MNQMKYYVDADGNYLGGWEANPPDGAIEVPFPPEDARQVWDDAVWQPVVLEPLTKLYKSTFIRRLTASEATALEQVLNTEEAYIRLLYQSVEWFDVTDALVQYLHLTLEAAYGLERADTLLEPEV